MNLFSLRFCVSCLLSIVLTPAITAQDVTVRSILQPSATVCGGEVLPVVVVGNEGTTNLQYFRVNYELDGTVVANFTWVGVLEPGHSDTISFPTLSLGLGVYSLKIFTSDPNFLMDMNPANDTLNRTFEVTESIGVDPPFRGDFDQSGFPYDGYILNNPDGATTWERTEQTGFLGTGAIYMNNYNYNGIGQEDEFTLPGINLSKLDKAGLSFYASYAQYGLNSGFADTLEVYVSGDCGVTFERVYQKYGENLATAPATTSEFFPRGSFDWRKEWVGLSDYFEATFLVVRFRHVSNYENNLFLDRIRLEKIFALDTEDELASRVRLVAFPDKTTNQIEVSIQADLPSGTADLLLTDIHGRTLHRIENITLAGQREISIPASTLTSGVYYLRLQSNQRAYAKPIRW